MTKRVSLPGAVNVPAAKLAGNAPKVDVAVEAAAAGVEIKVAAPAMVPTAAGAAPAVMLADVVESVPVQDTTTTTTTDTMATTDSGSDDQDYTPYIVGGVLLAGGVLALALSGGDDDEPAAPPPPPPPPPANTAPTFTSATTATIAENAAASTVVIDVNATDAQSNTITYTLGGTDAALFNINASTGEVTLKASADFETKASYAITVTATDNGSPAASASQNITVTVTNVNEAPAFATATATATVAENAAATTVVFDANATDVDAGTTLTYTLGGTDAAAFTIDAATGEVRLRAPADFETKSSYSFTVTASDGANGLSATQTVTLNVTDVAENGAPVFTSAATATVAENAAVSTVILNAETTDPENNTVTYSLSGADAAAFTIDPASGELRLVASADFEAKASYSLNIVATDNGNPVASTTQAVTVNVTDVNESLVVDIDGNGIPATESRTYSAADGNVTFGENAAEGNISVITGFTAGDIITTDVATSRYSFSSVGDDLVISLNNGGVVTSITLQDAVSPNALIFNEATAEAALGGFDFFRSSIPPAPPASNTLDGAGVPATFDASQASNTYTDRAGVANNTTINGFTNDDRIVASGTAGNSTATRYSFSSLDNDLIITFNQGGVASRIVIADVVSPNALITDEASAERAIGFDFFSYA